MGSSHIQSNVRQERVSDLVGLLSPFGDRLEENTQPAAANQRRVQNPPVRRGPPPLPADART